MICEICDENVFSEYTSPLINKRRDINYPVVLGTRESGINHSQLNSLFSVMSMGQALHHSTYNDISKEIHVAAVSAAKDVMALASDASRSAYLAVESETQCPVIAVSFDGSWQKRGHSSHNGVGAAIACDTGLVLDTEVISNYCIGCTKGLRKKTLSMQSS